MQGTDLPFDQSLLLLGIYSEDSTSYYRDTNSFVFIVARNVMIPDIYQHING